MFVTVREKSIIELVTRMSAKHTVNSLATYLDVSARTIQRDLKSVDKLLEQFGLTMKRNAADALFIDGNNEKIYRLMQQLAASSAPEATPEEKKLRLLIILMEEGAFFKKQVLSNQLGISTTTLTSYLDELGNWLRKFSVTLSRQRGVGVEIAGEEAHKRHALAAYFLIHFYEELIESLYYLQQGKTEGEKVLGYFNPAYLASANELVGEHISEEQIRLADSDYTGLVVHLALALQRTESGLLLDAPEERERNAEYGMIKAICDELHARLGVALTERDVAFLAVVLKGSKIQASNVLYYDSVLLGKLVKNMIRDVSAQLGVDLTKDFSLYQGLLAHMEPLIFRLKQKLESFNPLTEEIKKKYPVLFLAVKQTLETEFDDLEFSADEVAFIVLHFGSALLMNEERVQLEAVVVCPTGIGTSKMLASRIQKELPEIDSVKILAVHDFQSANLKDYDLVISTIRLPVTDVDYLMVSPLLNEQDISHIENYLQHNIQQVTRNKQYLTAEDVTRPNRKERRDVRKLLVDIKQVQTGMEAILDHFRVVNKHGADYWQVLEEVLGGMAADGLLDAKSTLRQLKDRETKGGLGIPGTNMALFHCRDESVGHLLFQVVHLDTPSAVKGMDGRDVHMTNVLLMLTPVELSEREQEIMSLISSSLIESEAAMMIFSSSNEGVIRGKLEELFYEYLQNNLMKE
ncbi:BglG family transcription antiterminator [Planococcus sp. SSTMD024]|uniref:BglG family transcription antiterminator n=1 Tax=Planococcus sp. SSTMD024 TaxID=3242163 RepID=UPI00351F4F2E